MWPVLPNFISHDVTLPGLDLCGTALWLGRSGPALFYVYSDGTFLQGDIFSVGSGSPYAYGVLDRGYRYDMSTQGSLRLARRAVAHTTTRCLLWRFRGPLPRAGEWMGVCVLP